MKSVDDDIELLTELGVSVTPDEARRYTPRQERILSGFADVLKFREAYGRAPERGEDRDIFERLYAVRLDRLRALDDCREFLRSRDLYGLLDVAGTSATGSLDDVDDAALLAQLGVAAIDRENDITQLRFVQSAEEKRAAEAIANRAPCLDFASFEPLFEQVRLDLATGRREARLIGSTEISLSEIRPGSTFILNGQLAHVAEGTDEFMTDYARTDRRLRVIYDNKTESDNILARSLQKALYRDDAARRITTPDAGPLFGNRADDEDFETGTIYVLRSRSTHPTVVANRDLIHKIGVTGGSVQTRVANAERDSTYLLAPVDIVATYTLYNINRKKLEALLHSIFAAARLELTIQDRFGQPVQPREWFFAPLSAIDETVQRIRDQSIAEYRYDPAVAALTRK
jgi:hypothetical protein